MKKIDKAAAVAVGKAAKGKVEDLDDLARALEEAGVIGAYAKVLGEGSHFERYQSSREPMDKKVVAEAAEAWLEGGEMGFYEWFEGKFDFHDAGDFDSYRELFRWDTDAKDVLAAFAEAGEAAGLGEADDLRDEWEDQIKDVMQDATLEAMAEADDSSPKDLFSGERTWMTFVPGIGDLGYDDYEHAPFGPWVSDDRTPASPALAAYLAFVGWSKEDVLAAWKDKFGYDPSVEAGPDASSYGDEIVRSWKEVEWPEVRATRLQDFDRVWEVIENASYGGVPHVTAHLDVGDLFDGKLDGDLTLKPARFHDGGYDVGLHCFSNGSGYAAHASDPIEIRKGTGRWMASEATGYGYDNVYGLVSSCYACDVVPLEPKPETGPTTPEVEEPALTPAM